MGDTSLHLAVCLQRWPCAELLLTSGGAAALLPLDALGWSPLHHALAYSSAAITKHDTAAAAWIEAAASTDHTLYTTAKAELEAVHTSACDGALECYRGARGEVSLGVDGLVVFRSGFASVRAGCFCPAGAKGYYELEVLAQPSCPQWGFCSGEWARIEKGTGDGVGDDGVSWGVDGDRVRKWHSGRSWPFGSAWKKGDVIGFACKLSAACDTCGNGGQILVSVNGDFSAPNGAVFDLPLGLTRLHPAFTSATGAVQCNLGRDSARPLRHAPPEPDFQPIGAFPQHTP